MAERGVHLPLSWLLGTFHSAGLVLVVIWLAYRGGGLGTALSSLNTLAGNALYLVLWTTTLFTARRAVAGLDWLSDSPMVMNVFFWRALRWGAANGVLLL